MSDPRDTLRAGDAELSRAERVLARARRVVPRKPERPLIDPKTDPRTYVCLRVAARYLGIDTRTLKARIDEGLLRARQDGRVINIAVKDLETYQPKRLAS